jgi:hypothetical protein
VVQEDDSEERKRMKEKERKKRRRRGNRWAVVLSQKSPIQEYIRKCYAQFAG